MSRRLYIFDEDEPDFADFIPLAGIMELTGNDEIHHRLLESQPKIRLCSYPSCDRRYVGNELPLLRDDKVRFNKPNDYLCPNHNRCFYCGIINPPLYRLCVPCMKKRELRYKLRALPPPLDPKLSNFIMAKTGLSRDAVNLICRGLNRIDQMSWAIACGANWTRRGRYADQARRYGSPAQTLWFLKQGCLPKRHTEKMVRYLDAHFAPFSFLHIRRYHAAMVKKEKHNVLAKPNISYGRLVMYISCEDANGGSNEIRETAEAFFKWAFLLLTRKAFGGIQECPTSEDLFVVDELIENHRIDLLQWLRENGYRVTIATHDRIREAEAKRDRPVLEFLFRDDPKIVEATLGPVFKTSANRRDWARIRFLLETGIPLPLDLVQPDYWVQLDYYLQFPGQEHTLWPLFNLMAEFNCPILESTWTHLVSRKCINATRRLLEMKFQAPQTALEFAIKLRRHDFIDLFLQFGMRLSQHNIVNAVSDGDLETLKIGHRHGVKYAHSDVAIARVFGRESVLAFLEECLPPVKNTN